MGNQFKTPAWVKDAIFYQIFPDRFARSERVHKPNNLEAWDAPPSVYGFKGGDLMGVVERLDYLQDLGINAIYFNPIFQSASNHRYHTHDYYQVDPILGGNKAFRKMLDEAHRRGIRVVLDGVFNHSSRGFFQFHHVLECGASSPYVDWFNLKGFPLNPYGEQGKEPNYGCWDDLPALPEFNTQNPDVRHFIYKIASYWLEQGVDGWRLDVPFCIDDDSFWQEFRHVTKSVNPEAYLVGEVPWEAQRWLKGDQFDAVMNYQITLACLGFFGGEKMNRPLAAGMMGFEEVPVLDAPGFAARVEELQKIYPRESVLAQLNLLDSHDMPRFVSLAGDDSSALRLATLFQMTYPGAPCIYYGNEIGMKNGPSKIPEDARYAFPWDEEQWDLDLLDYFRGLTNLRSQHPALRTGDFTTLLAENGIFAYMRSLNGERIFVIINNNQTSYRLNVPVHEYLANGSHLQPLTGGCGVARVVDGHITHLAIPPRSGVVFTR